jgi:hypothetical protein
VLAGVERPPGRNLRPVGIVRGIEEPIAKASVSKGVTLEGSVLYTSSSGI